MKTFKKTTQFWLRFMVLSALYWQDCILHVVKLLGSVHTLVTYDPTSETQMSYQNHKSHIKVGL